jgi:Mn-dependent DtxR family transcriptional regulator
MSGAPQYLLVIYVAEERDSSPVAPGEIADAVGRSLSATTEMLQRLEERGLVTHEPYEGAVLTPDGRETAEELYETYATLSRFFQDVLELDDYERAAMELAGSVSPVVVERLASTLLPETDTTPPADRASLRHLG